MKIGVKIYNEEWFLDHFKDKVDFFEVQTIQTNNYDFLKKYKLPIVIHAEHFTQGTNPANKKMKTQNLKSLNFARKLANQVNAKKIILHPGVIQDKNCSIKNSIEFIKDINDKRILIENLPFVGKSNSPDKRTCRTFEEIKEFLQKTHKRLCFDLSHSIVTANHFNLDKDDLIKNLLSLKPGHFHLCGQKWDAKADNHLSFKDSDIDYKKILNLFPKNAWITLEVTTDIKKTEYDIEYIKKIIKKIS